MVVGNTNKRLGREMKNDVKAFPLRRPFESFGIRDIGFDEAKAFQSGQSRKPCAFQGRILIIVEIVDCDDVVSLGKQCLRRPASDKAGTAGQ